MQRRGVQAPTSPILGIEISSSGGQPTAPAHLPHGSTLPVATAGPTFLTSGMTAFCAFRSVGIDVERSLRIATGDIGVGRGNQWFGLSCILAAPASRLSSLRLLSTRLKVRAPASLHDSGTRRHPASKGPHDVSVPNALKSWNQRTSKKGRPKRRKRAVVGPRRRPLFAGRDTWNKYGIARNCRR